MGDAHPVLTTIVIYGPLLIAVALGFFMRRRRGWIAVAGIPLALAEWALTWATGGFDEDREGTAAYLTFIFGVPLWALSWAAAVGVGYLAARLWARAGSPTVRHQQ